MEPDNNELNWYALYVQPRKEKTVEIELQKRGYKVFLPLKKEIRQWKDRKKMVEIPLVPSYIFTCIKHKDIWDIVRINGCVKFIFFENKPAIIPYCQIESLQTLVNNEVEIEVEKTNGFAKGQRVMIKEGRFAGVTGVIKHGGVRNNFSVIVDSLGMGFCFSIDKDNLDSVENYVLK